MIKLNKKKLSIAGASLLLISLAIIGWTFTRNKQSFVLSTTTASIGNISNTITATGTLEATNTVIVGTQVSGVIEKLYVDFNSIVKKGQLIAELDKSTLLSSLENAEADLERAEANFEYQQSQLARNKVLFDKDLLAKSDYDLVVFNYKTSSAEVKSAKANLSKAQRNLGYASIYSPIDGVVLNRAVEEGQTVAASMNTPELFTITNDLSTMKVEANIDEADIGQLEVGQRVEFTVDAFPNLTFKGDVSEIRLQPNETSNVITYTAIITVDNPELQLKPGMTASITVYIEEANDALLVAAKAIRFSPDRQLLDAYLMSLSEQTGKQNPDQNADKQRPEPPRTRPGELDKSHKRIWIKDGEMIRPVVIEVGIDDGSNIQVISGLEEGSVLVTSLELAEGSITTSTPSKDEQQKSPFVPQRRKGAGGPPH